MLLEALRVHGKPDSLYLDNGSTYVGETLALICARLGIAVVHARPYDPQARGKMERFWRTLNEDLIEGTYFENREHFVNELTEYLVYYNQARAHQGIGGKTPASMIENPSTN